MVPAYCSGILRRYVQRRSPDSASNACTSVPLLTNITPWCTNGSISLGPIASDQDQATLMVATLSLLIKLRRLKLWRPLFPRHAIQSASGDDCSTPSSIGV